MKRWTLVLAMGLTLGPAIRGQETRALKVDDLLAIKRVADPQVSPEGDWVAFTVTTLDGKKDGSDTDIYMVPLSGGDALRVTTSEKPESRPRWSPDGRYLAFLSGREGANTQVWLLDRRGGEGQQLTRYAAGVSDLVWSPDGKRLALVVSDVDPDRAEDAESSGDEKPKPIVINRLQFKRDGQGYLRDLRQHIHVFEITEKKTEQITTGPYDDSDPAWSPDGQWIAFTSNRTPEPDANDNTDIFVVAAQPNRAPRALTTSSGTDRAPVFSPDGKWVAYVAGGDPRDIWYATNHVALVSFEGGPPKPLTLGLDRNVSDPRFDRRDDSILFLLEDGGNGHLASVPMGGGNIQRRLAGERDIMAFDINGRGDIVVLESQPHYPAEVAVVREGALQQLSHVNQGFLSGIQLATVERFKATSRDGTVIDGFLTRPPGTAAGAPLPAILRIHGGPVSQYSTAFNLEWQILAAHGYAVVAANPRGSSGYGQAFSRAIWADWGNKDFEDVMAAVDHVIAMGVADADRLGVGGWSYGGILTNYVITKTDRFKAAISGASEVNYLSNYGTDHYQHEWEAELGLPWRNTELWIKISPWFQVEKIVTPTLILCGSDDMNVPLLNSEQLYQALRRLGRQTELVIYPGQNHGIRRPAFQIDRYERYLKWYDRYLKPERATTEEMDSGAEATSLLGVPLYPPPLSAEARRQLETNLKEATESFVKDPDDPDRIIWLGRRMAYLGRYRDAIATLSRGIEKHPGDFRIYRHRGHRFISIRELDKAIADLEKAGRLIEGVPDQIEPDGAPNALNIPTSTSHFNIWYHLGLAYYLKADFENALRAYRKCLEFSRNSNDRLVATSDWLYMTLRRLNRNDEAAQVLVPLYADMEIIENTVYRDRLLFYKGELTAEELYERAGTDGVSHATYLYGVGNWFLYNGQPDRAREIFRRIVQGTQWSAFGFIAAEAELARWK